MSLIFLIVVSFYNLCQNFADKCLKIKLLIYIYALYYAEIKCTGYKCSRFKK